MVLACESICSRTRLRARPRNLHTFSKVNLKYTKRTFPVGQARCSFHLPHSYNLQILLSRGDGASTNVEPCSYYHLSYNMVLVTKKQRSVGRVYSWVVDHFTEGNLVLNPPALFHLMIDSFGHTVHHALCRVELCALHLWWVTGYRSKLDNATTKIEGDNKYSPKDIGKSPMSNCTLEIVTLLWVGIYC